MPLLSNLSKYWLTIQNSLFPWLEEELGELSTNERKLVITLELVRLEAFLLNWAGVTGRPPADRVALARSFVTKMIYRINTTKALIDRLRKDKGLRRICGWERQNQDPSESTFSRAFSEFAESELPTRVHEALAVKTQMNRLVGHISRDSTAIEAREKPVKSIKPKKQKGKQGRPKKRPLHKSSI